MLLSVLIVLFCISLQACSDSKGENKATADQTYTYEQFEKMSNEEKEKFYDSFKSSEEFNKWLDEAKRIANSPWKNGGKSPSKYTWEEYQALSDEQKELFYESFGSNEEFDKWLNKVKPDDTSSQTAIKDPASCTWSDYEKMSDSEKELFYESFASNEEFDKWRSEALKKDNSPWENGGKSPSKYTWEEYQALDDAQKELFYESFSSNEEFDAWMNRVKPK